MTLAITFPIIRHTVSPTPIGRTPGHSSRAISRQATREDMLLGSTYSEHNLLAVLATESQGSADADLKDVHIHFHAVTSRPEGPAAPSIFSTVLRIICPSIASKMTACGSVGGLFGLIRIDGFGGCLGGCFFSKASRTVSGWLLSGSAIPCPTEVYLYCWFLLQFEGQHVLFLPSSV